MGIAPPYRAKQDGTAVSASEIKTFDPHRRPDVEPFPPGHIWTPSGGPRAFLPLLGESRARGEGADELFAGDGYYREIADDVELREELLTTIRGLHIGGLQRSTGSPTPPDSNREHRFWISTS